MFGIFITSSTPEILPHLKVGHYNFNAAIGYISYISQTGYNTRIDPFFSTEEKSGQILITYEEWDLQGD